MQLSIIGMLNILIAQLSQVRARKKFRGCNASMKSPFEHTNGGHLMRLPAFAPYAAAERIVGTTNAVARAVQTFSGSPQSVGVLALLSESFAIMHRVHLTLEIESMLSHGC